MDTVINGKVMSSNFKTSALYKWQAISLTVIVQCYVDYFRVDGTSDRLFVNTRGEKMKQGMINKGKIINVGRVMLCNSAITVCVCVCTVVQH